MSWYTVKNNFVLILVALSFLILPRANAVTYGNEIENAGSRFGYVAQIWTSDDDGESYYFICSGTLIKSDLVLTAAHCSRETSGDDITDVVVVLGSDTFENDEEEFNYRAVSAWWNPRYSKNSLANDVGLLLLETDVDPAIATPLALPTAADFIKIKTPSSYTLYGWGVDQNGDDPAVLQSAVLKDQTQLAKKIFKSNFNPFTMIAAGKYLSAERVYSGACDGDSGGPLIATYNNKRYIFGIVSFGTASGCDNFSPTIFAKVSYYLKDLAAGDIRIRK